MFHWSKALLAAAIVAGVPAAGMAQRSVHLGAAVTSNSPVGDFAKTNATGIGGLATLVYGNDNFPIGLRLDVSHARAEGKTVAGIKSEAANLTSVSANLIATFSLQQLKPYVIGGGGWYPYRETSGSKREDHAGINGGIGVTFPFPFIGATFLEGRYHRLYGHMQAKRYIAITLGVII